MSDTNNIEESYEDTSYNPLSNEEINCLNHQIYLNSLMKCAGVTSNEECPSEEEYPSEEAYYKTAKRISRTEAINIFCRYTCNCLDYKQVFNKSEDCPSRTETKRVVDPKSEQWCPLVYWGTTGSKNIPKKGGHPKLTQKQAIGMVCKKCQQTTLLDKNVKYCPAFWTGDALGSGCPLHPYRMGNNPFYMMDADDEAIAKKRELALERLSNARKMKGK